MLSQVSIIFRDDKEIRQRLVSLVA
jgi:hypothetical protein